MISYVQEILSEIHEYIEKKNPSLALALIEKELSMPYVPMELEKELLDLRSHLRSELHQSKKVMMDSKDLIRMLYQDDTHTLMAMHQLSTSNLRNYVDDIQTFLLDASVIYWRKALMIELLASQQITETMQLVDDQGLMFEFVPIYIEIPNESDGYLGAIRYLDDWLENDNPSMLALCKQLLLQDCTLQLPLSYSEEESLYLAASVFKTVLEAFGDVKQWQSFAKQHKIEEQRCWNIESIPDVSTH